ncbi:MAG TPA: surface-adhesin E family protein [Methylococcaceae bacterium]|jgi:hypothetical protein|nr:surface-adhesin E family protein [Methylococcaceae bacterium]
MKSFFFFLVSLVILGSASEALAADWWFVPWDRPGESEEIVYVDKSSLERIGRSGRITAWVWTVYRSDQSAESGSYRSHKHRLIVDCDKKEAGADIGFLYSAYGGLIQQYRKSAPEMEPVVPESIRETVVLFVCSGGKQPPRVIPVYDPSRDFESRFAQRDRERKPIGNSAPNEK